MRVVEVLLIVFGGVLAFGLLLLLIRLAFRSRDTDPMAYRVRNPLGIATTPCSVCCQRDKMLNAFGFCAKCWAGLTDEHLRRLGLSIGDGTARTITISKPWPNGRLIFATCLIASVAAVFGLRWFGF